MLNKVTVYFTNGDIEYFTNAIPSINKDRMEAQIIFMEDQSVKTYKWGEEVSMVKFEARYD